MKKAFAHGLKLVVAGFLLFFGNHQVFAADSFKAFLKNPPIVKKLVSHRYNPDTTSYHVAGGVRVYRDESGKLLTVASAPVGFRPASSLLKRYGIIAVLILIVPLSLILIRAKKAKGTTLPLMMFLASGFCVSCKKEPAARHLLRGNPNRILEQIGKSHSGKWLSF